MGKITELSFSISYFLSDIILIILTVAIIYLTIKDKQKALAINELKKQTKIIKDLLMLQHEPKFTTNYASSGYFEIENIGNDCYNLQIIAINNSNQKDVFKNWNDFYSSGSKKRIYHQDVQNSNYDFIFEDKFGQKMKQTLYGKEKKFSNIEKI